MRTTVAIEDSLLEQARRRAAERGTTVSAIIDDALRKEFAPPVTPRSVAPVVIFRDGSGPASGVDVTSNASMLEALDEGVPLDQRR